MRFLTVAAAICTCALAQPEQYNDLYRSGSTVFTRQPNALLVAAVKDRKPGRALDVGMGQGRNSIYLAKLGWDVTGFDSADEGVTQAKAEAARLGLKINAEVNTIEAFDFGQEKWDLIVLTYEPTKAIAPKIPSALRPGGIVVVEDRHIDTKRVWPVGTTLTDNELLSIFPGLRILKYEDEWARPDWSAKGVSERLVRIVAEKPVPQPDGCVWDGKAVPVDGTACWDTALLRCRAAGWQFTREKCTR